jgi:hypothetical protein
MVERVATEKGTVFPHKLAVGIKGCARDWHNYLRMDEATYLKLLALVAPLIKKKTRIAISPHKRHTAIFGNW